MILPFKEHSRIIQGLMRLANVSTNELYELIKKDLEMGINTFDISDVYGNGESERKFGEVIKQHPELREKMFVQSKCGIIKDVDGTYFDLSYDHIIKSCKDALKRCNLKYFDSYLLHRPDIFLDHKDILKAMIDLSNEGLVQSFGVSNFPISAINYLLHNGVRIETNQMQLGIGHLSMIREVLNCNINNEEGTMHAGDLFFYMKDYNIELQCWSPFQYEFFEGSIFAHPKMKDTMEVVNQVAKEYETTPCALLTAFLLKLGDNVSVITGSTNINHVKECLDGENIDLSKKDWYRLYCSTGNLLP